MSFKDIGTIIRRIDGLEDHDIETKDLKNKSTDTKALLLFSNGKKPIDVDVAIELNLSASEVQEMQEEFWALNQLHELAFVYSEIKTFLPSFLKLFHCLKKITKCWVSKIISLPCHQLMTKVISNISDFC